MDKRRYPREKTAQPVRLVAQAESFEGTIRDFSAGGLLVELEAPAAEPPDDLEVHLGDALPALPARIVRRLGQHVALCFSTPQRGIGARLRGAGPAPPGAAGPALRGADERLVRTLVGACRAHLEERTSAFLEHAKERLIDAADSARSDQGQATYFEAFTILRRREPALRQELAGRIDARDCRLLPAREGPQAPEESEELALVDETEFDIWLIEADIAANAESALHASLEGLEARLGSLLGATVEARTNPFGPRTLAMHCADALLALELEPLARKFALRSFGEVVLREAGPLYAELNDLLEQAGHGYQRARPARSHPAQRPAGAVPRPAAQAAGASAGAPARGAGTDDRPVEPDGVATGHSGSPAGAMLDLRRLVRSRSGGSVPAGGDGDAPAIEAEQLEQLLATLQSGVGGRDEPLERRMTSAIHDLAEPEGPIPALSAEQEDAVGLADELLQSMTQDLIASEQGKAWIRRLEIPLLKLLLEDQETLSDREHPARRLLDRLGQAHWRVDSGAARDRMMVEEVDRIIGDLVRGELTRTRLHRAAEQVERLVRRLRQRSESNTRRVLEACRGQERLRQARREVERRLASRFGGREVADLLVELLESGYRDLLALEALRNRQAGAGGTPGADGAGAAEDTFEVVERLDTRLTRPPDPPDRHGDEELLELVRKRLELTAADPTTQRDLVARLRSQLAGDAVPTYHRVEFDLDAEGERDSFTPEPASLDERRWLGQAKLLQVGDWMIFPDEHGGGRPLKLAWINSAGDRYVFVDRDGHKALELNQGELATRLGTGEATIGSEGDRPLTERSWQSIVERLQKELAHQATHDDTSGLLNRREFERRVRLRISESKLAGTEHGVILMDLDQFRLINSTAGHDAGDQVLLETGRLLQQVVDIPDADIARTGSDEFALLLPRTGGEQVAAVAEAIRRAMGAFRLEWRDRAITTTGSIGWTRIDRATEGFSSLFNQLEIACGSARELGDRVCGFLSDDETLARKDRARLRLRQLEESLVNDGLLLLAHRIVPISARGASRLHFEVLSRLRTPEGQIITPDEYVPAAEAHGRIHLLDRAVLEQSLAAAARSPLRDRLECLSVNISGLTFGRAGFVDHVLAALDRAGLPGSMLCLEITESAAMSDLARCADVLRELRGHGCRFSLDDFGTGLSSFSYLKHLPVDFLKIDGSFVRGIAENEDDRGMVRSMHEIARLLGKQTIAEFVEHDGITDVLRSIGVDHGQGDALALPVPLLEVLEVEARAG